jgi:hypothetical protein
MIDPEEYIEDILTPNIRLYEALLDNYFKKDFKRKRIIIQGNKIDLRYPRNFLNLLLYLNEIFKLDIEHVFLVYIKKLLQ